MSEGTEPHHELPAALELIGETPLLDLSHFVPGGSRLWAKAEFLSPGGSIKDRAALAAVLGARQQGLLARGQPVVEMTSGNMGAALAVVCNALGHPLTIVVSSGIPQRRLEVFWGMGVEVIRVAQVTGKPGFVTSQDLDAASEEALAISEKTGAFFIDQRNNPDTVSCHSSGIVRELITAVGDQITCFVACVGSSGTFTGIARGLKSHRPEIICAAVEPAGSRPLANVEESHERHLIQGVGFGAVPPHFDPNLADRFLAVSDQDVSQMRLRLAKQEGLHLGYSSAANMVAAIELAREEGGHIATLLCDTGFKYAFAPHANTGGT